MKKRATASERRLQKEVSRLLSETDSLQARLASANEALEAAHDLASIYEKDQRDFLREREMYLAIGCFVATLIPRMRGIFEAKQQEEAE